MVNLLDPLVMRVTKQDNMIHLALLIFSRKLADTIMFHFILQRISLFSILVKTSKFTWCFEMVTMSSVIEEVINLESESITKS